MLLSITALASNTMARTRQDDVELSLLDVPMTTLIVQVHFKVRVCALMMYMVLVGIFDDISHSLKVWENSVYTRLRY